MELNWEEAEEWIDKSNIKKEYYEPKWKFDCGFKLDFDGSLVRVSSRFYPPHKNTSNIWEGKIQILILNNTIIEKEFKNINLDLLKIDVEDFIEHYIKIILSKLIT